MEYEKNLFEKEDLTPVNPIQNTGPKIIINPISGGTPLENEVLNRYQWAINQVKDEIRYLINDGIRNGRIPPYESFTFNLRVADLPCKLKGYEINKDGRKRPVFDSIDLEWVRNGSKPNEYDVIFSTQSIWFPQETYMGCATHVIGGHGSYGAKGNEGEIERASTGVLKRSGKKDVADYMRRNSGYRSYIV